MARNRKEFEQPQPQQVQGLRFAARETLKRRETNKAPQIFVYRTPGRGQNGESSN